MPGPSPDPGTTGNWEVELTNKIKLSCLIFHIFHYLIKKGYQRHELCLCEGENVSVFEVPMA